MRVNPNITPDVLSAILQTQDQEQNALQELSSGKRVSVPSDDPLASAQMVANQDSSSRTDQYLHNIDTLTTQLQSSDSALSSVVQLLTQAISLGVQGSNGTLSSAQQQQIVQNLQGIQSQILQSANASVSGRFLFAGTATGNAPFSLNAASPSGATYNGNSGTNSINIADGASLSTNVPGDQIFQNPAGDVFGSMQQLITALQSGNTANIATATTQVRGALDFLSGRRVFYGSALNQLTSTQTFLQQEKVSLASQQNDLVGVDLATAATELTRAQTAHSAALAAAAKILPTSLLDYLK